MPSVSPDHERDEARRGPDEAPREPVVVPGSRPMRGLVPVMVCFGGLTLAFSGPGLAATGHGAMAVAAAVVGIAAAAAGVIGLARR